jgi:hypothetical protein
MNCARPSRISVVQGLRSSLIDMQPLCLSSGF